MVQYSVDDGAEISMCVYTHVYTHYDSTAVVQTTAVYTAVLRTAVLEYSGYRTVGRLRYGVTMASANILD
jgi:hypothetical protein